MTDYPRMLYRDGSLLAHQLQDVQLKVQNKFAVETRTVANADEEAAAVEDGWRYSPDPDAPLPENIARAQADKAKDEEIERLRAQVASGSSREPVVSAVEKIQTENIAAYDKARAAKGEKTA